MKCAPLISRETETVIRGARFAINPLAPSYVSIGFTGGRITQVTTSQFRSCRTNSNSTTIDLSGFLVLPGFVNAHDHLEFALFSRLGDPPYRNYVEWGEDIHRKFADVIAEVRAVPKNIRAWWGGLRNLLCGVTTVCHHNALLPDLQRRDFPVRVLQDYGWGHSLALGGDLTASCRATPQGRAFIVHASEGVDDLAREELWTLDRLGILGEDTVLVHGLAIGPDGAERIRQRGASMIVCPSSNAFLFGRLPDLWMLAVVGNLALGNDSPLTAEGDLLDEIRFTIRACRIAPVTVYRMVTTIPAGILKLENGEGTICESGVADLVAVLDHNDTIDERLRELSAKDIELVIIHGRVQLASKTIFERLPLSLRRGMEPLCVDGVIRWLRVPVRDLLHATEDVLGAGKVSLSGRQIRLLDQTEIEDAE